MNGPDNPHQKDAEACGRWIKAALKSHKRRRPVDAETLAFVARWAGHWGRLALRAQAKTEDFKLRMLAGHPLYPPMSVRILNP